MSSQELITSVSVVCKLPGLSGGYVEFFLNVQLSKICLP
jgi:hypothetical protein